ncbi:unnamed protein product, partial [Ectocarpus sp. 12 AP-2014]
DQRIGPEILKGVADSYRRLRNTMRFMLGNLAEFEDAERVDVEQMPELERWVLHRLAELDEKVRSGYTAYDFQGVFRAIFEFATLDLSSFYFDIRKDVLYCDSDASLERRAARTVLDILFHRLTTWLAPVLVFTMEEVWLERFEGEGSSVHLTDIPETPAAWKNDALAAKWENIRTVRKRVTETLEVARRDKVIGSSLEAAPRVTIGDSGLFDAVTSLEAVEDIFLTSSIEITKVDGGAPDAEAVMVEFHKADGSKCMRCWKILPDVGSHTHAHTCARCNDALG